MKTTAFGSVKANLLLSVTLFLSFFLVFSTSLFSQQNTLKSIAVTGYVLEKQTQSPISSANISLVSAKDKYNAITDSKGFFSIDSCKSGNYQVIVTHASYKMKTISNVKLKNNKFEKLTIEMDPYFETQVIVDNVDVEVNEMVVSPSMYNKSAKMQTGSGSVTRNVYDTDFNTEEYSKINENEFNKPKDKPLSTFSIDVDAASYSNVRRFIMQGQKPPKDAVRVEEFINYFDYNYPEPEDTVPFSIHTEYSTCPWNTKNTIVKIGIQGRKISTANMPKSNLVFLIDVSGSMQAANKLELIKKSFRLLVNQLRPEDKVAIVVYAGSSGLALPSTSGKFKDDILGVLDNLTAGGSTAGSAGIMQAYQVAKENFIPNGNNRIILATDGDFNVGPSSNGELERLIEEKRKEGIFLSVLGFGMGNYKDSKMEILADKGNGNYAYIDNLLEAQKVFVEQMGATLLTIAKDVKIQVEFNPARVKEYRLIGYENRLLQDKDFNDDTKDAGELGAGSMVTAIYEIVPGDGSSSTTTDIDPLKYQTADIKPTALQSNELMTVKMRYKKPKSDKSSLIQTIIQDKVTEFSKSSENTQFASAVIMFGMMLTDSKFKGNTSYEGILKIANNSKGKDIKGYRAEFIRIVELASKIK